MKSRCIPFFVHVTTRVVTAVLVFLFTTSELRASVPEFTVVGTFDDLPYAPGYISPGTVPNGYLGLNWDQLNYFEAATRNPPAGFLPATVSAPHVTANSFEQPVTITTPTTSQRFTFIGAYFGAGWNDGLQIRVDGYVNNVLHDTMTVTAFTSHSQWFEFDYHDINKLRISSSGGTPAFNTVSFTHFAMDNFTIGVPVPEPSGAILIVWGALIFVPLACGKIARKKVAVHY